MTDSLTLGLLLQHMRGEVVLRLATPAGKRLSLSAHRVMAGEYRKDWEGLRVKYVWASEELEEPVLCITLEE